MESKEPEASPVKMCALVASSSRLAICRLHVCYDCTVTLFGRSTCVPVSIYFIFVTSIVLCIY